MSHHVVVIGGGFGGLAVARALGRSSAKAPCRVTLIDRRNHHVFQPLLYQVATGGLSPGEIASPLRSVMKSQKNVETLLSEVVGCDLATKTLRLKRGDDITFDILVVAAGSETSYFGNDAWAEFAPGLKTVEEATDIRSRIFFAFEQAELQTDPDLRRAWLTFVVVGAGPTGVELSGTLGEIARDTLRDDFRRIRPEEARILLVDGNDRVLSSFPPDLSRRAEQDLIKLGVRFRNNLRVVDVTGQWVTVKSADGKLDTIPTHTVLWAAGVRASALGKMIAAQGTPEIPIETDRGGRVKVAPNCTVPGHPNVFVIGDLAYLVNSAGKQLPGVAQVAMQMGGYVARVIQARIDGNAAPKPFSYWDKGNMATIGRASAVADLGKLRFGGFIAWLMWLAIHLVYLVEFQNRLVVALQWGFQYLTFHRGARLITGVRRIN